MDRKSIIVLVVCFVVLMAWYPMLNTLYPPKPSPEATNTLAGATNPPTPAGGPAHTNLPANLPPVLAAPKPVVARSQTPEENVVLEDRQARFVFTSYGGGLKLVELKKHLAAVGSARRGNGANTNLASLNTKAPRPVLAVLDVEGEALQGDGLFTLARIPNGVRAEKQLTNALHLVKEFRPSTNYAYVLEATVRLENHGTNKLALPAQEWVAGTATPLNPWDRNTITLGMIDYNGQKAEYIGDSWFANSGMGCMRGAPRDSYKSATNVVWTAVHNQFFALALIPQPPAPQLLAQRVPLPGPSESELAADPKLLAKPVGIEAALIYPPLELAPNQHVDRRFLIYAGPKEYNTLARLGAQQGNNLDLIMDFGGFWGFFAKVLLLSMNLLNAIGLGYGLAIIVITVLIKLLFWPLTNASTKSMKRMAALQPQMKALQEKYKDDPKKMNLKLMEFMKENRISPVSSCFPMLLQIPVFFGFYKMLQSAIELRGAHFLWATDLSTADTVCTIPGLNFPVNLLPLIMGATMIWQARMTPPSPGMDPVQQKIMKYMPLMFMVFLYNFSAGLTLYWTVQNLLTIAQMKLTRNDSSGPGTAAPRKPTTPTPGAFGSRKPKL